MSAEEEEDEEKLRDQLENPDVYFFTANSFKHKDPVRWVKKIAKKEKRVRVSDNCVHYLAFMEHAFDQIYIDRGALVIEGAHLHVRKKTRKALLSDVLWSASWVDTVTIYVCLAERVKTDIDTGAAISPRNQLKALFHKNGHYTSKTIRNLLEENAQSLRHLELSFLPITLPNLRTYTHNGATLEFGIFNGVSLTNQLDVLFPHLVHMDLPRGACSLWTIHKHTGEVQRAKNVNFYYHVQRNKLREQSAVCSYWCFKYVYRLGKDVANIIARLVMGLPNAYWIVLDQNDELFHPPEESKYAIYKEKPMIFDALEQSNDNINAVDAHLKKIKNQISNLKKKRDYEEEDLEVRQKAQKRLVTKLFTNLKK